MRKPITHQITYITSLTLLYFLFIHMEMFSQDQSNIKVTVSPEISNAGKCSVKHIDNNRIIVNVSDRKGTQIKGLKKENFTIMRKNKKANILDITPLTEIESDRMRVSLIIDNSHSMSKYVRQVTSIIDTLIASLGKGVKVSIAIFDQRFLNTRYNFNGKPVAVRILPFTKDIPSAISFYKNGFNELSTSTYLYDEVYASIKAFQDDESVVEKNIAIVLSDGADISSYSKAKDIYRMLNSNITFYTIDFVHQASGSKGKNEFLENLANKSNGEYYKPTDIDSLRKFFQSITSKIVDRGYQITYEFPKFRPTITHSFPAEYKSSRTTELKDFPGLIIKEVEVTETFPLLNYVFFDDGHESIPERYILLNDATETTKFNEHEITGGSLGHYYNLLNILGSRFKQYPDSIINLIGCSDGKEIGGISLSQKRCEAIKNYFINTWNIPAEKINMEARLLPEKPSGQISEQSDAENRRVEIICNDWRITKPVSFLNITSQFSPPIVNFKISMDSASSESIEEWELDISRNDEEWYDVNIANGDPKCSYDWLSKDSRIPPDETALTYKARIKDNGGETYYTTPVSIPVKKVRLEVYKSNLSRNKKEETVSLVLVLFDFAKFDIGLKNNQIIEEFVKPKLANNASVEVKGFTDIIGSDEINLILSGNRAKAVSERISGKVKPTNLVIEGYGARNPIFDNSLPECRFYNRTVQLLITNYRQ
jgi:outer membrane protein OmpA-like peptidoglycan-associated protein